MRCHVVVTKDSILQRSYNTLEQTSDYMVTLTDKDLFLTSAICCLPDIILPEQSCEQTLLSKSWQLPMLRQAVEHETPFFHCLSLQQQYECLVLLQANCNQTSTLTFAEYSQAWDFRSSSVGQLQVDVYSNSSKDPDVGNSSPLNLRINQVHPTICIGAPMHVSCRRASRQGSLVLSSVAHAQKKEIAHFSCMFVSFIQSASSVWLLMPAMCLYYETLLRRLSSKTGPLADRSEVALSVYIRIGACFPDATVF